MKTKILILALLFTVQFAKGQSFNKNSSWIEVRTKLTDEIFFQISTYKIDGDTLIDNKNYSKVFRNDNFYSVLRETEDNKIYARFFSSSFLDKDKELLIYDFDWYPNKTLYHQPAYDPDNFYKQAVLGSDIDSIQLLDGKYYKYVGGHVKLIKRHWIYNRFF